MMRRIGIVVAGLAMLGALPPAAAADTVTVGSVQTAAPTYELDGISCAAAGCIASGSVFDSRSSAYIGAVDTISGGTPATATSVETSQALPAVSCSSPADCLTVGEKGSSGVYVGVVVPIVDGTPGTAIPVPGTLELKGVACAPQGG
jgi:hypothetical protein